MWLLFLLSCLACLGGGAFLGYRYGHRIATMAANDAAVLKQAASDLKKG